jgi:hypothetical protein
MLSSEVNAAALVATDKTNANTLFMTDRSHLRDFGFVMEYL